MKRPIDVMEIIRNGRKPGTTRFLPEVECANGTRISIQASSRHYCEPRNDTGPWTSVEIWVTGEQEPQGWVPVAQVDELIEKNGGLK